MVGYKVKHRFNVDRKNVWYTGYVIDSEDGDGADMSCKVALVRK